MSKIYCIYCGVENDSKDKKCINKNCNKPLNPKSHMFRNYVIDKCKGDINDSLFDLIKKFIKTKLYGIILSASVIGTVSVVITNAIANNYITELTEEPVFSYHKNYTYLGEGLTKNEVIDKYLDYVKNGDLDSANGLIAENFLTQEQLDMIPFDKINAKYYSKIKHDFISDNKKYFYNLRESDGIEIQKENGYTGRFGDVHYTDPEIVHNDKLDIYAHYMELTYCLGETCNDAFPIMEILETIEIDGKVYILSEYAFLTDNYSRVVRYIFMNNDLKKIDNNYFNKTIDSCLDEYGKIICDLPIVEFGEV